MLTKIFGDGSGNVTLESAVGGLGKIGGDMLGGWLSKNFNTPQGAQGAAAFLSGSPTGNWHLTIGNPLNPIAMVGNLVLTTSEYKFIGPLGKDDFPSELEVVVTLKSGRDRDKGDIENMFNAGRGRLYQVPEGFEDFTNISGKQPPVVTAYSKLPAPASNKNGCPATIGLNIFSVRCSLSLKNSVSVTTCTKLFLQFFKSMVALKNPSTSSVSIVNDFFRLWY